MRDLKKDEFVKVVTKLQKYIKDTAELLNRPDDKYNFYFHRDRVFYCRSTLAKHAASIEKKHLLSFGTCIGRFSKTGKFKLHITALDFLSPYAMFRVWLKAPSEQQFLYGQNILRSGIAKMSENTPQYAGVIVMNMSDMPLGFGVAAKSSLQVKNTDPMTVVLFHQADVGEYIRSEETIV
uniref:60S ribosome subunit biogenesis protein NIP7 homolog n=1 Tax=Schistosoma japonicum TaxID=6182 RepID=C1L741_SCHJA|nr:60S ribosome subunit biogenesis protein NIP7 [Schistosoma japonicum]CAX75369.1 60S ribosome subunit biogenesis protein NIP7 [Schistosoma japonicum]CAX75370.1 60S ribosome subunit biogenesis protein NIP7 [Schistosoma japonicum]CAX75371.1 60S ribosome subunit biogenesis protein NIP7 [Schistosoma japonicum]CAX75372.1 60S ribosome subunit biogenesis protein NIP7 [Schistosoma japonicum]